MAARSEARSIDHTKRSIRTSAQRKMTPFAPLQQWQLQQHHSSWFTGDATLLTITIFVLFYFYLHKYHSSEKKKLNLPPSPRTLPLLGNLHQLLPLPHRSLRALSQSHGPLMLLHFGQVPTVIISSAELAEQVLKTQDPIFAGRPPSSVADRFFYNRLDIGFAPYGEYWRQVRRIGVHHLLSGKRVESFRAVREAEVELMVENIRKSKTLVNLSEMMATLTNDIVCRAVIGCKYSDDNVPLYALLSEVAALLGSFPFKDFVPWFAWVDRLSGLDARLEKTFNGLEKVLEDHLDRNSNKEAADGNNFVQVLLSLHASESGGVSLGRGSIKGLILDMFVAGTETTFTAVDWTMAELMRNPKVKKKVQEEIRAVMGQSLKVREEDIDRMEYLKAVSKEVLRLHPPAPLLIPHESLEQTRLQGYDIPAKMRVMINAWAIGRDEKYWEKPEEFMPERFMNSDVDFKGQDFQLIPFGAGRRGCPGMAFAVSVVELVLANLLHRFDWELPHGMQAEDLDMSEKSGIGVHRKASLIVRALPRLA